jgi:hypothetical protein
VTVLNRMIVERSTPVPVGGLADRGSPRAALQPDLVLLQRGEEPPGAPSGPVAVTLVLGHDQTQYSHHVQHRLGAAHQGHTPNRRKPRRAGAWLPTCNGSTSRLPPGTSSTASRSATSAWVSRPRGWSGWVAWQARCPHGRARQRWMTMVRFPATHPLPQGGDVLQCTDYRHRLPTRRSRIFRRQDQPAPHVTPARPAGVTGFHGSSLVVAGRRV